MTCHPPIRVIHPSEGCYLPGDMTGSKSSESIYGRKNKLRELIMYSGKPQLKRRLKRDRLHRGKTTRQKAEQTRTTRRDDDVAVAFSPRRARDKAPGTARR
ncbi:hypothetical protein J6590_046037 [Homalodisca vitripennis]|nr:hypothetical protein J6590_046037 [Homalodisca vitripennis]